MTKKRYSFTDSTEVYTIRAADGRYLLRNGSLGYYDEAKEYKTYEGAKRQLKRFPKALQDTLLKAKAVIVRDSAATQVMQPVAFILD